MKSLLYISNIEVPYRVKLFNQLSEHFDLTVLYERESSKNRDEKWSKSIDKKYKAQYLNGLDISEENRLDIEIYKRLKAYDYIVIGCYNSPSQILAAIYLKLKRRKFWFNLDGEQFINNSIKGMIKKLVLKLSRYYLVAGKKATYNLEHILPKDSIIEPYNFSSLTKEEITNNNSDGWHSDNNGCILIVGQYYDYKGMDIAAKVAIKDIENHYRFVGTGVNTGRFIEEQFSNSIPSNVEVIPFLNKESLAKEYRTCRMLVLPSRQECWGLVVNEAASFGTPIVSTTGSGAAVEFLADGYPELLAKPGSVDDLLSKITNLLHRNDIHEISRYLKEKSKKYSIEENVYSIKKTIKNEI